MRVAAGVICGCLVSTVCAAETKFWSPLVPPRAQYRVNVTYSSVEQKLLGTETIRFRNDTGRAIGRLAFRWFGDVQRVRANGIEAKRPLGEFAATLFDLPQELGPGREIELAVDYSAPWKLGARTSSAITSFLNPQLWWGGQQHDDYEVRITVPEGHTIATSGRWDPATGAYVGHNIRAFGLFIGKRYQSEDADAGDVHVRAVFTQNGRACAEAVLKTAVDAIGFYRQRFGFYPQSTLSIVPGGEEPVGGYPAATGLVVIHGQERVAPPNFWRWITAHEIGHEYFMEHVLADGEDPLSWVLIGLGIHADREYRRARGITDVGSQPPKYVEGVKKGYDTTLDITSDQQDAIEWDFNNVVDHGKSAALVDALETVIGAETFDAVYRRILREYAGKRLGWRDFQRTAELESGQSLEWFFDQWARSSKNANYRIAGRDCSGATGAFVCTVRIERTGAMHIPITIAARFADGSEQRAMTERLADTEELTFRSAAALKEIVLEPDSAVALAEAPNDAERRLAEKVRVLPWTGSGDAALAIYRAPEAAKLADPMLIVKLAFMLYDGMHYPEALQLFTRLQDERDDMARFIGSVWRGHILDLLNRREEAIAAYNQALKVPGPPTTRHDQYGLTINKEWVQDRLKSPFQRR